MNFIKGVAEYLMPVLTTSQFTEKGVITPEEFVLAGDQLVYKCKTWEWAKGDPKLAKAYLPKDKQFLVTKSVPSLRRADAYSLAGAAEEVVEGDDGEGGWVATHTGEMKKNKEDELDEIQDMNIQGKNNNNNNVNVAAAEDDDEEIGDMDDVEEIDPGRLQEPVKGGGKTTTTSSSSSSSSSSTSSSSKSSSSDKNQQQQKGGGGGGGKNNNTNTNTSSNKGNNDKGQSKGKGKEKEKEKGKGKGKGKGEGGVEDKEEIIQEQPYLRAVEPEDDIVRTRTYDLTICYDKYYQTPRLFLSGYDERGQALSPEEIMQDVSADHANKTVTVESHPHMGHAVASIHPCRHASVMKRLIEQYNLKEKEKGSAGRALDVGSYMFMFLKFMSSVLPTLEYDYTIQT